jgi:predicted nucleotidyltransferase
MSTVGFGEAFNSAEVVRIAQNPACDVKVCTPAGLTIMKLISWDQAYPVRSDDAKDIHFILTKYVDAGNEERLYGSDKDIVESPDFDFSMASPRLLGRDMALIANEKTVKAVSRILDEETREDSQLRLAHQMLGTTLDTEGDLDGNLALLCQLLQGLSEGIARKSQI